MSIQALCGRGRRKVEASDDHAKTNRRTDRNARKTRVTRWKFHGNSSGIPWTNPENPVKVLPSRETGTPDAPESEVSASSYKAPVRYRVSFLSPAYLQIKMLREAASLQRILGRQLPRNETVIGTRI